MAYLNFIQQVHTGTKRVCLLADNKAEFVTLTKSDKPIGTAQELTEETENHTFLVHQSRNILSHACQYESLTLCSLCFLL